MFDNKNILSKMRENSQSCKIKISSELCELVPSLTEEQALSLYSRAISLHQKSVQGSGEFFEHLIAEELNFRKVIYTRQVSIDENGIIVSLHSTKNCHAIDFVIQHKVPIEIGISIMNYKVISCKTTCRERWSQDNWSLKFSPALFILITNSSDYPSSRRFCENTHRKIITSIPKKKDLRIDKLGFEDLCACLEMGTISKRLAKLREFAIEEYPFT